MRSLTIILISIFSIHSSHSQIHEIGIFVGGSNFIGDIGATNYISPNKLAIGGIYKWNRSPRHSYRISAIYTILNASDSNSDDARRVERDYSFNQDILELSLGMEFTFWGFNLHNGKNQSTPYLYSGVSVAKYDNFYFKNDVLTTENTSSWGFGIPMVLGFKTTFLDSFVLAAEIGARYTFTDELDGSIPDAKERKPIYSFGNINNNDWYVFTGLTLTYTFGRNPCYCY